MKSQIALSLILTSLFFNEVIAGQPEITACNNALEKVDIQTALMTADKMLEIDKNDKDALICQGRALSIKGDYTQALASYNLADAQSTDPLDKTKASFLIGDTYALLRQFDSAISSYQQAILNAKLANNKLFERLAHHATGDVYTENKQLAQAIPEHLLASQLAANDNERGESYEKIAQTYHNLKLHDLALEYQLKTYLMYDAVGTLDQYAHASIELGRYYALTKNYVSAERTLNKIIKFAKDQGGAYYEARGSYVLARVKMATGDTQAAKNLVDYAKSIAKSTHDKALDEEITQETQDLF
jgi:tetratricopeptide (TPR) repeat protein